MADSGSVSSRGSGRTTRLLSRVKCNERSLYLFLTNIFGATATNRDTGGYHDKIREIRLKIDGATQDIGNGFLFRDYDTGGLWFGMQKSLHFHKRPAEIREVQVKRIMKESRAKYDLGNMIAEYIRIYERLNGGRPLT